MAMELIAESEQADDSYGPFLHDDVDAPDLLRTLGHEVQSVVPECVGMSLSLIEHGVTFTVATSSAETSVLDAMQYAEDGPCLRAMDEGEVLAWTADTAEGEWHAFALASASLGVASSLSLPIVRSDVVVGGFNLYASSQHAFDTHHDQLAALLGAWSGGATTNADLGFGTRDLAREAPELLRASVQQSVASCLLGDVVGCTPDEAVERLRRAAVQSAVPLAQLIDSVVAVLRPSSPR